MPRSRRKHPKKPKGQGPRGRNRRYRDPGARPNSARPEKRPGAKVRDLGAELAAGLEEAIAVERGEHTEPVRMVDFPNGKRRERVIPPGKKP